MDKTTLLIDKTKVERVKKILQTKGLRDTIDRALDEVLATAARQQVLKRMRKMEGLDLDRPEVLDEAWR